MIRDHHSLYPETAFQKRFGVGGRPATLESGGGGGGPSPIQEQYISTAPRQFMPYLERTIGKAEALSEADYQTYGGERLGGPSDIQMQARQETGAMQTPGQFGTATGLATAGGLSALQAGQYGPSQFRAQRVGGPQLQQFQAQGPEGIQTGMGSFTGEGTAQQFMSPYMQQVVDVQKQAAVREAQIADQQARLGSARQGTYGGARQALATAERERGLLDRLSNIQGTGSQAAFDAAQRAFEAEQGRGLQAGMQTQQLGTQTGLENLRAQLGVQQLGAQTGLEAQRANQQAMLEAQRMAEQSRQFGAGLGLQGAQAATQAGQALGQLGSQQQTADLSRLQAQEQAGARTQAEEQQRLDLAYQDFLAQQRYPYQQLEFMRNMVSGMPLGQVNSMYQAPQSATQNLMQLGLGGLGLYGAYGGGR
jgi:hypothetical protein